MLITVPIIESNNILYFLLIKFFFDHPMVFLILLLPLRTFKVALLITEFFLIKMFCCKSLFTISVSSEIRCK